MSSSTCLLHHRLCVSFFFFNDPATTEIYTLSLHDALPIYRRLAGEDDIGIARAELTRTIRRTGMQDHRMARSEEHTSEFQSRRDLVCRLLLEKKKKQNNTQLPSQHTVILSIRTIVYLMYCT